jgi:hypothetical protein
MSLIRTPSRHSALYCHRPSWFEWVRRVAGDHWPPGLWFSGRGWIWIERIRIGLNMPLGAWWSHWQRQAYFHFEKEVGPFPSELAWLTAIVLGLALWFRGTADL